MLCRFYQCAGADCEVVHDDRVAIGYFADDLHQLRCLPMAFADLVGDGEGCAQAMSESARSLGETCVGRDDDGISQALALDRAAEVRHGVEVVDRYTEEPLDLRRVEIERDHTIRAGCLDRVGADTRTDRDPWFVLFVALTESALARENASIQNSSSMKFALVGKTVDCTT